MSSNNLLLLRIVTGNSLHYSKKYLFALRNDRRHADQRSSDTVSQRSDDYGHDDYGHHGGYHGGGGCSLQLPGLCALLGLGALLAVGGAAVAAIVLTVTMGRKRRRSFPGNSFSNETAAITIGKMLPSQILDY